MAKDVHAQYQTKYRGRALTVRVYSMQGDTYTAMCNVTSGEDRRLVGINTSVCRSQMCAAHEALDHVRDQIDVVLEGPFPRIYTEPFLDKHFEKRGMPVDARVAKIGPRRVGVFLWRDLDGHTSRMYQSIACFESTRDAENAILHGFAGIADFDDGTVWEPVTLDQRLVGRCE